MERLIASTIVFHDSVLNISRNDNEAASAALWQRLASGSRRLPREVIRQVRTAIEATAHHTDPVAGAGCNSWVQWVLDLDLSPMGSSRHRVRSNRSRLRSECLYLSASAWQEHVERFLQALQDRDRIFHSPPFTTALEVNARHYACCTLATLSRTRAPALP